MYKEVKSCQMQKIFLGLLRSKTPVSKSAMYRPILTYTHTHTHNHNHKLINHPDEM
jgi:hypothetical protein